MTQTSFCHGSGKDVKDTLPMYMDSDDGSARLKRRLIQGALVLCGIMWSGDFVYRVVNDISYVNREICVLYKAFPRAWFLAFEYLFETTVIVFVGVFIAVLLGRVFLRFGRFFPSNPVTAFLYASVIPVCSCAVIPLLSSMRGRARFSTTMAFVLASPLLSPYILVLSFTVLGFTYGMLRIACSFILVMIAVGILGVVLNGGNGPETPMAGQGCTAGCSGDRGDVYLETFTVFRRMFPLILVGAALGLGIELLGPRSYLMNSLTGKGITGVIAWIAIGVPLYFCNGAEVLFLRPLVSHGFPLGTAVGFSLTSTAVCTTALAMFLRIIGMRLTVILAASVFVVSCVLAVLINAAF